MLGAAGMYVAYYEGEDQIARVFLKKPDWLVAVFNAAGKDSAEASVYLLDGHLNCDCSVRVFEPSILADKLHFGSVSGNFMLEGPREYVAQSLDGCPHYVGKTFDLMIDTESLKGCPQVVMADFRCDKAKSLVSYSGAPSYVKGMFYTPFRREPNGEFDDAVASLAAVGCDNFYPPWLQVAIDEKRREKA